MSKTPYIDIDAPGFNDKIKLNTAQLVSFVFYESLDGCAQYSINLVDEDSNRFNRFIQQDGGTGKTFRFRFGTRGDDVVPPTGTLLSDWKTLELLQSKKRTFGARTEFTFRGLCHGHALNRHNKDDGNWENAKISTIVRQLAQDAGLQADVEETVGFYTLSTGKLNSGKFIRDYLLPLAYCKGSKKDWRFWIQDGTTVIFRPTDHNEGPKHFFADRKVDDPSILPLINPEAVKTVARQFMDGSGRITVESHDPMRGRFQKYEVNEGKAGFGYMGGGRPKAREKGTSVVVPTHFTEKRNLREKTTREQLIQEAETRWARHARGLYRMVSEVPFAAGLNPGDKVKVITEGARGPDEGTGIWQLYSIKNLCTRGELRCFVVLERRWEGK